MWFSKEHGFTEDEREGSVEISEDQYAALLAANAQGYALDVIGGEAVAITPPAPTAESLRPQVSIAIETWRDMEERAGVKFDFQGRQYDGGEKSRLRLQDAVASGIGASGQFFWTDETNDDVPMDSDALNGLYAAMMAARVAQGFKIHIRQRQMKEEIATLDVDALASYQVGWPAPPDETADPDQPA